MFIPYLKRDRVSIHYKKIDSENPLAKDTLILLHGLGPDMNSWKFVLPYFLQNYHVFMYDLRGFGKSDAGDETRNLTMLTDDLTFLIEKLNISSYHIIAQGFSGFIGVQHAAHSRDSKLKTLTLMTAPVYFPKLLGNKIINERKRLVEKEGSLNTLAKKIITQNCYPLTEEKASILFQAYNQVSPTVYFELFQNHFEDNAQQQLNRVLVPTLLLSGAEDDVYPPELFGASLHLYPNARHFIIPNASFMMQMDQPERTAEWIDQFIKNSSVQPEYTDSAYRKTLNNQLYTEMHEMMLQKTSSKLRVNMMNGFSVCLNGERIHGLWGKRKAKQLLSYLSLHQSVTREELCDVFWPDMDLKSAKNSLRVALHHLKKTLEVKGKSSVLEGDKELVYIRGDVQSDVQDYTLKMERAHQQENDDIRAASYKQLLRKAPAKPLPGLYEEWFLNFRDKLEKELGTMATFLADYYEIRKAYNESIDYLQLAVRYYNYDEQLVERLEALERYF